MIISEKQIMQLIMLARTYQSDCFAAGEIEQAIRITNLLNPIIEQQSEELKEILQ